MPDNNTALTEAVYYILLSLDGPNHGYGIMQTAEALSGGRVRLAAGTLYGALNSLSEKGWIVQLPASDSSRKKEYVMTDRGRTVLEIEYERLRRMVAEGAAVLNKEETE